METGEVLNVYPSAEEAGRSLGISRQGISRVANGTRDRITYQGYIWRFAGDKTIAPRQQNKPPIPQGKQRVEQIDYETGTVLAVFDSINEAATSLNITNRRIRSVLTGLQKSTGGFTFRKVGKPVPFLERNKKRRPVEQICLETGKVLATYRSMKAAGDAVGVTGASIHSAATGHNSKTSAGYGWRFVEPIEE